MLPLEILARTYALVLVVLIVLGVALPPCGRVVQRVPSGPALVYEDPSTPVLLATCGPRSADGRPVLVSLLASSEKREWLEPLLHQFGHLCPNIQVELTTADSFDAVDGLLGGRLRPQLWSPASSTALYLLNSRWQKQKGQPLLDLDKERPLSLLRTPIVWLMPDSRYQAMQSLLGEERGPQGAQAPPSPTSNTSQDGPWMRIGCAKAPRVTTTVLPASANAAPADRSGSLPLRFTHTDPMRSLLGLQSLYLLAFDYLIPPRLREAGTGSASGPASEKGHAPDHTTDHATGPATAPATDLDARFTRELHAQRAALRDWLRRCEAATASFMDSERGLTMALLAVGTPRYDIVVSYENLALPILDGARLHAAEVVPLRISYPKPTLWADHPVVRLGLDPAADSQIESARRAAADKLLAFLQSEAAQQRAVELGFRPGRPELSVRSIPAGSDKNPFLRLGSRGVLIDVPEPSAPTPRGDSVQELMKVWEEALGRL